MREQRESSKVHQKSRDISFNAGYSATGLCHWNCCNARYAAPPRSDKTMDLKLTEEERLIKNTAAQFVDKELISREGNYLRQDAPFLTPGAPARRRLHPEVSKGLAERARGVGLWSLEVPETLGGTPLSTVARVLVHREFGRSILPFRPISIPAFLFETPYGEK